MGNHLLRIFWLREMSFGNLIFLLWPMQSLLLTHFVIIYCYTNFSTHLSNSFLSQDGRVFNKHFVFFAFTGHTETQCHVCESWAAAAF